MCEWRVLFQTYPLVFSLPLPISPPSHNNDTTSSRIPSYHVVDGGNGIFCPAVFCRLALLLLSHPPPLSQAVRCWLDEWKDGGKENASSTDFQAHISSSPHQLESN